MAEKTAVEWLIEQVNSEQYQIAFGQTYISIDLIEQAKQMEKDQIIEAFDCDGSPQPGEKWISNGEQYYRETYNKNK